MEQKADRKDILSIINRMYRQFEKDKNEAGMIILNNLKFSIKLRDSSLHTKQLTKNKLK